MNKTTKFSIMDRSGDSRFTIVDDAKARQELISGGTAVAELMTTDQAIDKISSEMSDGKWVRIVDNDGKSDTITDISSFQDWNKNNDIVNDTQEIMMLAALIGG